MESSTRELQEEYTKDMDEGKKSSIPGLSKERSNTVADDNFHEMEQKGYMIRSEDFKSNEDLLWIWGFKFPTDADEAKKAIHHGLVLIDMMAHKEHFRIVYFHSNVTGAGSKIPKMIKKLCKKMSKEMRRKLVAFDIVHPNFALKWALFFFDKFSLTDYKIHFRPSLDSLYELIDIEQKTFVIGALPVEITLFDGSASGKKTVGDKKVFKKEVVSTSDSKYKDFDVSTAVQGYEILGKHIYEFPRDEGELVPEIFTVLFSYFERNEAHISTEGLFRIAGNKETMKEIEKEMEKGNYFYLGNIQEPLSVAGYMKKVFREMGEPLCTFDLYSKFKDINDETCSTPEEKVQRAFDLVERLPEINKETFKALLSFLQTVTHYKEHNKMGANNLAIIFAPNLFKAYEVTPNDMIYAQVLVKTLTLMIANFEQS